MAILSEELESVLEQAAPVSAPVCRSDKGLYKALVHAHYSRQTALLAAYRNAGNAELGMAL